MMTLETLRRFCEDDGRLSNPWSRGEYTYASEGHVIIRVPRLPDVPENATAPDADKIMIQAPTPEEWLPVPELGPPSESIPCLKCNSVKPGKCRECDGLGHVVFENDFNKYEGPCKGCRGLGFGKDCPACDGLGAIADPSGSVALAVGDSHFQVKYLRLLALLQDCKIGPNGRFSAARLTFDGGDGLIMPMPVE